MATFLHRALNRDCEFSDHSNDVRSAVFQVHAEDKIGTAFYIGDDEWLTAAHVVEGQTDVTLRNGANEITAVVIAGNSAADIGVLKGPGDGVKPLRFGRLSNTQAGDDLFVVGYPLYVAEESSVAKGVMSRTEQDPDLGTLVVTDASANPGNSGGPLVNECGDVIGMIVAKLVAEDIEGIAYAVAETTLSERLPAIRENGTLNLTVRLSFDECFGSSESQYYYQWEDGPAGWEYAFWQHRSDGSRGAIAFLDAGDYDLKDYSGSLPKGCDFTPYLWLNCSVQGSFNPSDIGVWWSGIHTGATAGQSVSVAYQTDETDQLFDIWLAGEDYSYVGGSEAGPFAESLLGADVVRFWGHDTTGKQVIYAEFDMTDVGDALQHLTEGCGAVDDFAPVTDLYRPPTETSVWTVHNGTLDSGTTFKTASTSVEISEYSWQDDHLTLNIACLNDNRGRHLGVWFEVDGALFLGTGGVVIEYKFGHQAEPTSLLAQEILLGETKPAIRGDDLTTFVNELQTELGGTLSVDFWDWWQFIDEYDYEGGGTLTLRGADQDVVPVLRYCGY